jgi:hypothetical protein
MILDLIEYMHNHAILSKFHSLEWDFSSSFLFFFIITLRFEDP